jgi:hypothetical protein
MAETQVIPDQHWTSDFNDHLAANPNATDAQLYKKFPQLNNDPNQLNAALSHNLATSTMPADQAAALHPELFSATGTPTPIAGPGKTVPTPPTTAPPVPPPTAGTPLTPAALKTKYASNPYLMDQGRYNWGAKLNNEFPIAGGNVKQAVMTAAKQNGIDPALLYSSAMEEGMSGAVDPKYSSNASANYVDWSEENKKTAEKYPVDGFYNYGLDQFAGQAKYLEKKGYLPVGFSQRFQSFPAKNEKNESITAPAFQNDQDALMAKSAMMKLSQDQLEDYSKKSGLNLSDAQKKFFLLANYNGGEGNMQKMIQSYKDKGYLKDDKFLDPKFKPASYAGIYKNVQARLQSMLQLKAEGNF